ncbi:MAG: hypothetical protein IKA44_04455 [Clostridia bacterium]|nr:hypothetical protein [Clostridia bacterium]
MIFYKNNAYPEVCLHDCNFQIKTIDNKIQCVFPEGVAVVDNEKIDWSVKGMIQISDCSIDEITINSIKPFNFFGIHRMIAKEISLQELNEIFQRGGFLQVFDECYSYGRFIWKCAIYPYKSNKKFVQKYGEIEISAFTESPLEYYLDK